MLNFIMAAQKPLRKDRHRARGFRRTARECYVRYSERPVGHIIGAFIVYRVVSLGFRGLGFRVLGVLGFSAGELSSSLWKRVGIGL